MCWLKRLQFQYYGILRHAQIQIVSVPAMTYVPLTLFFAFTRSAIKDFQTGSDFLLIC